MTANTANDLHYNIYRMSLDDRFYHLDEEEKSFFKRETRIQDDDELKAHIIAVQSKAYL